MGETTVACNSLLMNSEGRKCLRNNVRRKLAYRRLVNSLTFTRILNQWHTCKALQTSY